MRALAAFTTRGIVQYRTGAVIGGRYEIEQVLGVGGFATTYQARDRRLGRRVAIKVLHEMVGADPDLRSRFEREARAAAQLSSPFIVPVYDFGLEGDRPYLVMQLMPGGTLRERLDQEGPFAPAVALAITTDMLRGLSAIHAQGIIHRDIKPANVLFGQDGVPRLSDFGIAYLADATVQHTRTGTPLGTPAYMAPEQVNGQPVVPATDLYATGVVLFEMLTGQTPFAGMPMMAQMLAQVNAPPPLPSDVAPGLGLPVRLEREVMRALAKPPAERRPSAAAMADALHSAAGPPMSLTPAAPPSRHGDTTRPISPPPPGNAGGGRGGGHRPPVAPPVPPPPPNRLSWLVPVLLLAGALAIVVLVIVVGDLGRAIFGLPASTATTQPTSTNSVVAVSNTPTVFVDSTTTSDPDVTPPVESRVDTATTELVAQTSVIETPTLVPETPTPTSVPETSTPTSVPETPTPTPTVVVEDQALDAFTFAASDWQGAQFAPAEFGRDAVVLYGSESASSQATLRFTFAEPPAGQYVLTVQGLGDETNLEFPFGIEVNGMFVGQSPATFTGFNVATEGRYGEQAAWDSVRIVLPAAVFQPGENEITFVSLMAGDYDDRPPYLLLGAAELTSENPR